MNTVYYGDASSPEEFYRWVSVYHGSSISVLCKRLVEEKLQHGNVNAWEVLDEIETQTRQIDISKINFSAQFNW